MGNLDPSDASSPNLELAAALLAIIADPKSAKDHLEKDPGRDGRFESNAAKQTYNVTTAELDESPLFGARSLPRLMQPLKRCH